jgi:hypothetical protein
VSSGVADVAVRRGANGLEFTEMEMVLDTTDTVLLSELAAETDSALGAARVRASGN